jgi:hypothetical protein
LGLAKLVLSRGKEKMDFRDTHTIGTQEDEYIRTNGVYTRQRRSAKLNRYSPASLAKSTGEPSNLILKSLPAETYGLLEPFMKTVMLTKEQFLYQEDGRLDFLYFR